MTTAGSCSAQRLDRRVAVAGADHLIAVIGPFELALQALVVLDDEQDGEFGCGRSCAFPFGFAAVSAAGSKMVKVVPLPGRLSTLSRPPIAAISERASNAPMPKPPGLVEANGWNRRLRTKSPSMPTPLSAMAIDTVHRAVVDAHRDRLRRRAGLDRVLEQMADRLLERGRVDHRPQAGVAEQPDLVIAALGRDRRRQDRPQRLRLDAAGRARRSCGDSRASRSFILPTERLQRRDHVGAEFGIVGVALGIAREQRQLADEVLHVVQDEGEAAVEFLEPLGVRQALPGRAPRRASSPPGGRRCAAGRNLPSRAGGGNRARRAGRGRPGARGGSAGCRPRRCASSSIHAGTEHAPCRRLRPAAAERSNSRIRPRAFDRVPEVGSIARSSLCGGVWRRPVPASPRRPARRPRR